MITKCKYRRGPREFLWASDPLNTLARASNVTPFQTGPRRLNIKNLKY